MKKSDIDISGYCDLFFHYADKVDKMGDLVQDRESLGFLSCLHAFMAKESDESTLFIVPDEKTAESILLNLRSISSILGIEAELYPERGSVVRGEFVRTAENGAQRSRLLNNFLGSDRQVTVISVKAFVEQVLSPKQLQASSFTLKVGDSGLEPISLAKKLLAIDYDNEYEVKIPGEYSQRGGIVDIFTPTLNYPVRIEFFGDEIDRIAGFDTITQRTRSKLKQVQITPRDSSYIDQQTVRLTEYLSTTNIVSLWSDESLAHLEQFVEDRADIEYFRSYIQASGCRNLYRNRSLTTAPTKDRRVAIFAIAELFAFENEEYNFFKFNQLKDQLVSWRERGYRLLFSVTDEKLQQRLAERLQLEPEFVDLQLTFTDFYFPYGLLFTDLKLVILAEQEIFNLSQQFSQRSLQNDVRSFESGWAVSDIDELRKGEFIVHTRYGIAEYQGVQKISDAGAVIEVLKLEFADDVHLHVPLIQIGLISRYVGQGGRAKLSRLGSKVWQKKRDMVSDAVLEYAADLIRLQAVRETVEGHSYEVDEEMESAFAASFKFTETPDQQQAIDSVLSDMLKSSPMDRLLCGDVGYGKTEVAMRAVFRAVINGWQVAVVAPTTVLAQQHYRLFKNRLSQFAINVDILCRLRSPREQQDTLASMLVGEVDMVVGTHRLLQKDVEFAKLGLIVVDEEQKFGVKHKEALKMSRLKVDVLTMSATPIPRTLHLSISGVRNLSTINTPPQQRLAIKTFLGEEDDSFIGSALAVELARGGQSFVLHNRVKSIDGYADYIRSLVPSARVAVGHGQMKGEELEDLMLQFQSGEVDILVATTIIENGVDIPNANTIIVDRADRFGLAELYQLRGRVGRSHRQAYAYLIVPPQHVMSSDARDRISAIMRYSHLGAGIQLALRDLEIRGAGNILGSEQSGHIGAIGFELYCEMLKDAVNRLKNLPREKIRLLNNCSVKLSFLRFGRYDYEHPPEREFLVAEIPADYINSENLRLNIYRRLMSINNSQSLSLLAEEIVDRFGQLPVAVENLLRLVEIEVLATNIGYLSLSDRSGRLYLERRQRGYEKIAGIVPILPEKSHDAVHFILQLLRGKSPK